MMEFIKPSLETTKHSEDYHEWVPSSFENFLIELDHIVTACEGDDPAPFFRGQTNYLYPLDSTFVRNFIREVFRLSDYRALKSQIRHSVPFHRSVASLLLLKFGTLSKPSEEALRLEKLKDIDSWYEFLKHLQQYPENDRFINGTFLLDWTLSKDIGVYFATFSGRGDSRSIRQNHGALWVFDPIPTGNTLQTKKLGDILGLMNSQAFIEARRNLPLIFHPKRQTTQSRAVNQQPVYVSQMDYRHDLAQVWTSHEQSAGKRIFIKLVLPDGTQDDSAKYLESKGVSEEHVYPE